MKVGIIGVGNIGGAFARLLSPTQEVSLFDHKKERAAELATECGAKLSESLKKLAHFSEVLIIAVKPQDFEPLGADLSSYLNKDHLVVSCVTGWSVASLQKALSTSSVVRLIPNIALAVGQAVMAFEESTEINAAMRDRITLLFKPAGSVVWLPEASMNAVSALAGSGIAFVLMMIESMVEAGIAMGLGADQARRLAAETFGGAAALAKQSPEGLESLRWKVTSPGGTTIEGVRVLEASGGRSAMIEAVLAAYERAEELSRV